MRDITAEEYQLFEDLKTLGACVDIVNNLQVVTVIMSLREYWERCQSPQNMLWIFIYKEFARYWEDYGDESVEQASTAASNLSAMLCKIAPRAKYEFVREAQTKPGYNYDAIVAWIREEAKIIRRYREWHERQQGMDIDPPEDLD